MDPKITLSGMNFQVTDTVADFGAGSGFLAFTLAQMIPSGHVFAIEINKDMVTRIAKEAEDKNITNIHPLWGDIEILGGSGLADAAVDTVVLSNVLFQLEDKKGVFAEVKRVLKPGGRVLLIDWSDSFSGLGPAPHHVFTKDQAMALLGEFGFIIKNDNLPVGDHHYAILSSI